MALTPEQWEEAERGFAESRARTERMDAERRKREGIVVLCLDPSAGDPRIDDPTFQSELADFAISLRNAGIQFNSRGMTFDAAFGGGYTLPEFTVQVLGIVVTALTTIIVAWIQGEVGRKMRLKIGDVEVEGHSAREIEDQLRLADRFQASFRDAGNPGSDHHST